MRNALLVSAACNVLLLALLAHTKSREGQQLMDTAAFRAAPTKAVSDPTLEEALAATALQPFEALRTQLYDEQLVAEGYRRCDLALTILASCHGLDVGRAQLQPSHTVQLQGRALQLYPNTGPAALRAIRRLVATERWPLTPCGLWQRLRADRRDESLQRAWCRTDVHRVLERLLQVPRGELLALAFDTPWELLEGLSSAQRHAADWSATRRREFLLASLRHGSRTAAELLVRLEPQYALQGADDATAIELMALLDDKTCQAYAKALLQRPRSSRLLQYASKRLATPAAAPQRRQ